MLSPPITLVVPNPRAQSNYACVGLADVVKVVEELAQVGEDHVSHFCSSYANLGGWSETGLKKAGIPAKLLSSHRKALLGGREKKPILEGNEREWWFVVMCGGRFPMVTYRLLADQSKSPRREGRFPIDRKISTKSVL